MTILSEFSARRVTRVLLLTFAGLLAAQLIIVLFHFMLHRPLGAFSTLFDMDLEANLPLFFNSLLFFIAAGSFHACGLVAGTSKRWHWSFLALIFVFLGIDEGSQIHERFLLWSLRIMKVQDGSEGLLHYAWVVPYGLAVLLLGSVLIGFLLKLPGRTRNGLMLSAVVFLSGAVLLEMVGGSIAEPLEKLPVSQATMDALPCLVYPPGQCNLYLSKVYVGSYMVEESCEMLGLILCIYILMRVLEDHKLEVHLKVVKPEVRHGE